MGAKADFAEAARAGSVLAAACSKCGRERLATEAFCRCGSRRSEPRRLAGAGRVASYTIITVPPAGFEGHVPYAWAVLELPGGLRVSGFMGGVSSPAELPVGAPARVAGFDGRGLVLERQ